MSVDVDFHYYPGIPTPLFRNVRLVGNWDAGGRATDTWTEQGMQEFRAPDGCPAYRAAVAFPDTAASGLGWGVLLDGPGGRNLAGMTGGTAAPGAPCLYQPFQVPAGGGRVQYHLTYCRQLGTNKWYSDNAADPAICFSVWAPNAREVELVIGDAGSGYVYDDSHGIAAGPYPMQRDDRGIWRTDPRAPTFASFAEYDHLPYMFRIRRADGTTAYRTDLYSRCQIGRGKVDPAKLPPGTAFSGRRADLDGTVGCAIVIDPEKVAGLFDEDVWPEEHWVSTADFWRDEFDPDRPLPTRPEDFVVYELHIGGLGFDRKDGSGQPAPGTLADAVGMLDYLVDLGVNAVELMPFAEFEGWASWGYGTSHYFAVEYSGGGRDQLKHFVRECHRRGIAVVIDVVYNHYHHDAERAEWAYDSAEPAENIYYWYEPASGDQPSGYLDNESTGYVPRFSESMVRHLFVDSAVALLLEFHIDGLRVDQTTSIHAYAHRTTPPYASAGDANAAGVAFLQEWTRTLRLVKPAVLLIAEDHSDWEQVTVPVEDGGLGFDLTWYSRFYHHLIGDATAGQQWSANLLTTAAYGDGRPLALSYFAGALEDSANRKLVYHESHDEAGNSKGSGRTIVVAVGRAPLIGETRRYAEARARFAASMTLLSAGTPMISRHGGRASAPRCSPSTAISSGCAGAQRRFARARCASCTSPTPIASSRSSASASRTGIS